MTENGTYRLNNGTFQTVESFNIYNLVFIVPPKNEIPVNYIPLKRMRANFIITDMGNAYVKKFRCIGGGAASRC